MHSWLFDWNFSLMDCMEMESAICNFNGNLHFGSLLLWNLLLQKYLRKLQYNTFVNQCSDHYAELDFKIYLNFVILYFYFQETLNISYVAIRCSESCGFINCKNASKIGLLNVACVSLNLLLLAAFDSLKSFILRILIASFIMAVFQYTNLTLELVIIYK